MTTIIYVVGDNIQLSIGEQEWLLHMQKMFGCTEQEAIVEIVKYKREQAYGFEMAGNLELAKSLLVEIGEWSSDREEEYRQRTSLPVTPSKDIKLS